MLQIGKNSTNQLALVSNGIHSPVRYWNAAPETISELEFGSWAKKDSVPLLQALSEFDKIWNVLKKASTEGTWAPD